jgi:hypothetical protein
MPLRDEPPRTGFYPFTLDGKRGVYLYAYRDAIHKCLGAYIGLAGAGPVAKIVFDTWKLQRTEIRRHLANRLLGKSFNPLGTIIFKSICPQTLSIGMIGAASMLGFPIGF